MSEFKRKPGEKLGLRLDLKPTPTTVRFVSAFLFDKDGNALVPASVALTDKGDGSHVENTTVMQSVPQMVAKYKVYFDALRTNQDTCEYLGSDDYFDLDALVASQLPPDSTLTGSIQGEVKLEGEMKEEKITAELKESKISGVVEDPENLNAVDESATVAGETNQENLTGKID